MSDALKVFADKEGLRLPDALYSLVRAAPRGADLGTVRLLSVEEIVADELRTKYLLSPCLLPIAEGGQTDAFALYIPPERGLQAAIVCAVNLESGVYAPISSDLKGFAAWMLLLRRAQASLPAGPGFAVAELMGETEDAAKTLARALGLEPLLRAVVEPDPMTIAANLVDVDPSSPYGHSTLARCEEDPKEAIKRLSPALAGAPFSAGLFEQAADLFLTAEDVPRAVRSMLTALMRLEPNLQTSPYKLDEPDEETGNPFEPLYVGAAYRFLQEHADSLSQDNRTATAYLFLKEIMGEGGSCNLSVPVEIALQHSRRKLFGGDPPGARWILHLARAEHLEEKGARQEIEKELAGAWSLGGSLWYRSRFEKLSVA